MFIAVLIVIFGNLISAVLVISEVEKICISYGPSDAVTVLSSLASLKSRLIVFLFPAYLSCLGKMLLNGCLSIFYPVQHTSWRALCFACVNSIFYLETTVNNFTTLSSAMFARGWGC